MVSGLLTITKKTSVTLTNDPENYCSNDKFLRIINNVNQ